MNGEDANCPVCFESLHTEWPPLTCANHHKLCCICAAKIEGGRYGDDPCSGECPYKSQLAALSMAPTCNMYMYYYYM